MSIPQTKILLSSTIISGGGYSFTVPVPGNFDPTLTGSPVASWLSGIADLNGEGLADFVFGVPGDGNDSINGAGGADTIEAARGMTR